MARAAGFVAKPGVIKRAMRDHNPSRVSDRVYAPRPRGGLSIQVAPTAFTIAAKIRRSKR